MRLASLFSGGKDSTYALYLAKKFDHQIVCLITMDSKNKDSYMFHTPIDKVDEIAKKMNLPLIKFSTAGEKEKELADLKRAIKAAIEKYQVEGIVTGAVASTYQASRIQKICNELDLYCFNPLWQKNQIELLNELVANHFRFKIIKVATDGLDDSWIGRVIDKESLPKLIELSKKYGFNPAFEGGEAETEIVYCPLFKDDSNN
ncbi:diphthine--ammonia ligase [Candidatus Woesearchaeota archaeon]|nr:diphthine--ammonia ligase [Candidatus Woesearchaeota archaeon]